MIDRPDLDAIANEGMRANLIPGALDSLDKYLASHPSDTDAHVKKAGLMAFDLRYKDAARELAPLVQKDPSVRIGVALANAYYHCGDLAAAEIEAIRAMALEAPDPLYLNLRGDIRLKRGNAQGAKLDYQSALELAPNDAENWRNLAAAEEQLQEFKAAYEHLSKSLEISHPDPRINFRRGIVAAALGRWRDVEADFDTFITTAGEAWAAHLRSRAYAERGWARYQLRKSHDLEDVEEALRLTPDNLQARFYHGTILSSRKDPRAKEDLEAVLSKEPNYAPAHVSLAATLFGQYGDKAGALAHFKKAAELDPNYAAMLADNIKQLEG